MLIEHTRVCARSSLIPGHHGRAKEGMSDKLYKEGFEQGSVGDGIVDTGLEENLKIMLLYIEGIIFKIFIYGEFY